MSKKETVAEEKSVTTITDLKAIAENKSETSVEELKELAALGINDLTFGLEEATSRDMKIPLIYVAQAMSKVVEAGTAKQGDIVENMENRVLGGKDKTAKLIPFYFQKAYQVQKMVKGKKEFSSIDPWDREREYEEVRDGETYLNYPCFNFFVMIYGDETYTKYMLSFRGSRNITSGGRPMLTQLINQAQRGIPPFMTVYDIGVKQVENEKGKWFVFTAHPDREAKVPVNSLEVFAREARVLAHLMKQGNKVVADFAVMDEGETSGVTTNEF